MSPAVAGIAVACVVVAAVVAYGLLSREGYFVSDDLCLLAGFWHWREKQHFRPLWLAKFAAGMDAGASHFNQPCPSR